jgi:hypothetical protein
VVFVARSEVPPGITAIGGLLMKRVLLYLLVVLACLSWSASAARADWLCADTNMSCITNAGNGTVVGTMQSSNCFNILAGCIPCDFDGSGRSGPAKACNTFFAACQDNCGACVPYGDLGTVSYCYDKNGNCSRGTCGN